MNRSTLLIGDSREQLRTLDDASVDAVVTDPPYELGFMGKAWDASGIAYDVGLWREVLRVLKPGGHLLAFGATRTYHRLAVAIEDAGFDIRDSIHWVYGSGFPKSLNISKALDKAAGARGHEGRNMRTDDGTGTASYRATTDPRDYVRPPPVTDAVRQWFGWGTALKPSHEPIVVARKPLDGTVAANVLEHGVGGINIDGCRVAHASDADFAKHAAGVAAIKARGGSMADSWKNSSDLSGANDVSTAGRWPPNAIFSHLPECGEMCAGGCAVAELDAQSGTLTSGSRSAGIYKTQGYGDAAPGLMPSLAGDSGGASRFFPVFRYQAKPSRAERDAGLRDAKAGSLRLRTDAHSERTGQTTAPRANTHATVKPVELMRWLVRLVTPPGGLVLDPFTGSGTTGCAAILEGARFVGVELLDDHAAIARGRIAHAEVQARRPNASLTPAKAALVPAGQLTFF